MKELCVIIFWSILISIKYLSNKHTHAHNGKVSFNAKFHFPQSGKSYSPLKISKEKKLKEFSLTIPATEKLLYTLSSSLSVFLRRERKEKRENINFE